MSSSRAAALVEPGGQVLAGGASNGTVRTVAEQALAFAQQARFVRSAVVNGASGVVVVTPGGRPYSIMGFTVTEGKIVEIEVLADPARIRRLDLGCRGGGVLAAQPAGGAGRPGCRLDGRRVPHG